MSAPAPARAATLRSSEFRTERSDSWSALERLVHRAEAQGLSTLTPDEISRLASLYRATVSALSVARAISLDRHLLLYLESLVARAYVLVYGPRRRAGAAVAEFVARRLPRAVRAAAAHVSLAALFVASGVACGWALTAHDPERFHSFVSPAMAQGRTPEESTETLRAVLYHEGDGGLAAFASYLFSHNAQIGILAFALGFLAGLPVFLLLFTNGLVLGAFAALYASRRLATDFWAWVLPHGVTELLALVLCGAAGLVLGEALVFPGRHTRLENLRLRGADAGLLVLGAVGLDFVAAAIEGFFRQLVHEPGVRWLVAGTTAVGWALYFGWAGRRRRT